jgi:hypothetical protein
MSVEAQLLYDNGTPEHENGQEMTHWIETDDFTLTEASCVNNIRFWDIEIPDSFAGTILWEIYANTESNSPGTLLASGDSINLSHIFTGVTVFGPFKEFVNDFDIAPVCLPAGTYWLALHNGPRSNSFGRDVFWASTANGAGRPSHRLAAPFVGPWVSNAFPGFPSDLAFQVGGTRQTAPPSNGSTFAPVSPARVWDTRFGPGPTGQMAAGEQRSVRVAGVGGVPATGVTSVVLNVTAVDPSGGTYITAWPTGEARPLASNLNVPPGDVRPNLVIVKVGEDGHVSFYNNDGNVHLVADVAGWFGPDGGQRYTGVSPARIWDSRFGPGPVGRSNPGQTRDVTVTGVGGVPASGVTAVVLNVTAVRPSEGTHVTVWPMGENRPLASNLNVPPGDNRPNLVIVKVGAAGQISVYNHSGDLDFVADVAGYFSSTGSALHGVSPARLWDSRFGPGPVGQSGPGETREVVVTGLGGVPATGVSAVVLNVTAVGPSEGTYVTVWPTGEEQPLASNLNIPPGDTRPNLVIAKVGAGGRVSFYNNVGNLDIIADVAGWFDLQGAYAARKTPSTPLQQIGRNHESDTGSTLKERREQFRSTR